MKFFLLKIWTLLLCAFTFVSSIAQDRLNAILPSSNYITFDKSVVFTWNSSLKESSQTNYSLSISTDSTFSPPFTVTTSTSNTQSVELFSNEGVYYWKVELLEFGVILEQSSTRKLIVSSLFTLPNLQLLFLTDTGIVINSGDQVSRWINLADTSKSAVQPIDSLRPRIIDNINGIDSNKAVRFDGMNDYLSVLGSVGLSEMYTIANWRGASSFNAQKGLITGRIGGVIFRASPGSTSFGFSQVFPNRIQINQELTSDLGNLSEYKLISGDVAGTYPLPNGLLFGSDFKVSNRYWDGDIVEVIGFSAPVSDSIRGIVRSYFCNKYGKPLSLGADIVNSEGFCDTIFQVNGNYNKYRWSNGDTTASSTLSPGNSYSLTVTNQFGCEFIDDISVIVPLETPKNQFLCIGDTFVWNTELPVADYSFNWSDGTTDSLLIISSEGEYSVTITDNNSCSFLSDTLSVQYDSTLTAFRLGNDTALCSGNTIQLLSDSSLITSYLWSRGDTTPSIKVNTSGNYVLEISNGSCFKRDTINITIKGQAPLADFLSSNLCFEDSTNFTDISTTLPLNMNTRWGWNFGDGSFSNQQNPRHAFNAAGTFSVTLEVENDSGCVGVVSKPVIIHPKPVARFSSINRCELDSVMFVNNSTISNGLINRYYWDFGDVASNSDTSISENPNYLYSTSGQNLVRLIAISNQQCSDTVVKSLTINSKPTAGFIVENTFLRDSTSFTNTSTVNSGAIVSNFWNFGNGIVSNVTDSKVRYSAKGSYLTSLKVTSDSNCVDSISKQVLITDAPPSFKTVFPKLNQVLGMQTDFKWSSRDSATTYELQVSTDSLFSSIELSETVAIKTYSRSFQFSSGKKYWRVIAKNGGAIDTSNLSDFTIFKVQELDSLNLWLKADSGLTTTAGTVSQWNDLSDSALILDQIVVSRQPVVATSTLNNYPLIYFDNSDDRFVTPLTLNGENFTISSVYNLAQTTGSSVIRGSNNWRFGPFLSAHRVFNGTTTGGKTIEPNRFVVQTAFSRLDTVSNYVNNSLFGNAKNSFPPGLLTIGANPIDGNIAEVIVVNGLISEEKRELMDLYLMDKYSPPVDAGINKVVCSFPDSVVLDIDYAWDIVWNTGDTTNKLVVNAPGKYFVTVTDQFERISVDSMYFVLDTFNYQVNFTVDDTTICSGEQIELIAGGSQHQYSWNIASTEPSITVDSALLYVVDVINCEGITSRDSIQVNVNSPQFTLGVDTTICHNGIIPLQPDSSFSNVSYAWSTGETGNFVFADTAEVYALTVQDNFGCVFSDTISVSIDSTLFGLTLGADTILCEGNQIQLKNPNSSITSYLWSTADATPSVEVDTAGAYKVTVGNGRCFVNDTINVAIKGKAPIAGFTAQNFCFRDSLTFTDTSKAAVTTDIITNWNWAFGNGDTSILQNPKYNYAQRSSYTVSLEVETDKGCVDTVSQQITINPLPRVNFNFQQSIACAKARIFHEDSSFVPGGMIQSHNWNFGDAASSQNNSTFKDPFHNYDTTGTYNVSLVVTSDLGCIDSIQKSIFIEPTPVPNYTVNGFCIGDSVFLTENVGYAGTDSVEYFWTIRLIGGNFVTDRRANPVVKLGAVGDYDIGLRVRSRISTTEFCEANFKDTTAFFGSPNADFLVPQVCENDSFAIQNISTPTDAITNYTYVLNSTDTLLQSSPKYKGYSNGAYSLSLLVTDTNSCSDSIVKMVVIDAKPIVDFTVLNESAGIPFNLDIVNNTQSATTYQWNFGNGDTSSLETPNYTYSDTGTYQIRMIASSSEGCLDSASRQVIALQKLIDATLSKLFLTENALGDIEVSFQIFNSGFNTINNLQMSVDLNNEFEFREQYITSLYKGDSEGFQMDATFIPDAGKKIDFVCVRILSVNGESDAISSNNELCELGFNDEFNLKLYPNPVQDFLNFQYTLPDDGAVQFQIFDAAGRERKNGFSANQEEGYYTMLIDFSLFERGIYFYRFTFNGIAKTGKFIVE